MVFLNSLGNLSRKVTPSFQPKKCELVTRVFPRFRAGRRLSRAVPISLFSVFFFSLIGCCDHFCSVFTTLHSKAYNLTNIETHITAKPPNTLRARDFYRVIVEGGEAKSTHRNRDQMFSLVVQNLTKTHADDFLSFNTVQC